MRKVTLLFAALLSFAGATMAQKSLPYSYGFEDYNLDQDGWTTYFGTSLSKNNNECKIVGDAKKTGSYGFRFSSYNTSGANAQYLISPELNASNGVDVSFAWKVSHGSYSESFKVGYSTTNTDVSSFTWDEGTTSNSTSWKNYENSFPAGTKYVAIYYYSNYCGRLYVDDFSFTAPLNGPALVVEDGTTAINNGYNYNFGLAIPGTTHYFRLSNPGTTNLSVSVSETGNFGATLTAPTIPAGSAGYVLLNITMPSTSGSSAITITPEAGSGIDPFVINVSGTIRDANKLYEQGFTALPEDWTTTGTWYYNETNGAYTNAWYLSSNARLITPKLNISEGETFFVEAKGYSTSNTSYQHLQMQYSADGTTWTNFDNEPTLDPSNWQTFSFTGVPAGQYYIAINASQADVRMFYGGELPQEPKMVVTQPASLDFGVIDAETTKTFTIANTGHATLEGISVSSSNDAIFSITGAPTSLEAGTSAEVTITMATTTTGALSSDITVSATDMTDVQFTVTGVVLPEGLMVVDFNDNQLPANWTNASWTFASGAATGKSSSAYLTTPKLIFKDGDLLVIKAKRADSDATDYITIQGSDDNGATWTAYNKKITGSDGLAYPDFGTLVLSDIPATVNKLRFVGYYVVVDEIAGLTYDQDSPTLGFAAEDFAAGKVTNTTSKNYTVSNTGTGTLTVNISSDNEKFTVSPAQLVITDEPKEFTVTFNYEAGVYGKFNANITVTPTYDESAAVTFAASAQVVNPDLWGEDFEEGTLPMGWVANNWTIGTNNNYENDTQMALAPSCSTAGTLITPCLTAKEGDVLTWDSYFKWDDEALKVEWSSDNQENWTELYNFMAKDESLGNNSHKEMSFTAPADGDYYLRFTSTYSNGVDNFLGFKLNLPDHIMAITANNIPTSGSYSPSMKATKSFNASVTVKESRGVTEEGVVAKLYMGNEVIGTSEVVTVEANSTKQIAIVATPTVAASSGIEMHIEVEYAGGTLTTEPVTRYVAELVALALTETEEQEITTGYSAIYDVVTLTRNFAAGWNTFVAPVATDMSEFGDGAKAYAFTGYADGELKFTAVTDSKLTVATPYVIYIPEAIQDKVFTWESPVIYSSYVGNANIVTTHSGVAFQGTYAPIAAGELTGKYGVTSDGHIQKAGAGASIKGFRAFFEVPAGNNIKALVFDGEDATGIKTLNLETTDAAIYNIAGQRIQKTQKGINIINGKKILK